MKGTKTNLRAAIYARYSTDKQSAASIPDQIRICHRLAEERGWLVVEVLRTRPSVGRPNCDPNTSGCNRRLWPVGSMYWLLRSQDRISRDLEHIAGLHKRMRYLGVEIVTKAEGLNSEMHIGLGGTMSELYVRNLAEKTHRGLEGR